MMGLTVNVSDDIFTILETWRIIHFLLIKKSN